MEAGSAEHEIAESNAASEALENGAQASSFSLELTQDQKDIRDWVRGFAEQTVRPAASEWDEREETPYR